LYNGEKFLRIGLQIFCPKPVSVLSDVAFQASLQREI